ncbi:Ubiquitin carboxyl-terminal hydrolase isozyme L5 [Elsinoe australis]|uniref:ubiquitinyl hydrolase 1 n=1 Tax=Elsinoe australis TaxID=40998 RepID=A0A2P8A0E3_9PEZI|nr:Ubiquitin carboxyl-terminal hydrolase isozyme L5 [Elsinoe australis]
MARGRKSVTMGASKKRKLNNQKAGKVDDEEYERMLDRKTWAGWVEIESEPAYFNVILRELGTKGVKIQELLTLEDDSFDSLQKPVHALLFLFQYRGNDLAQVETGCPSNIWFANQVPDFSCASVALLNIVNNIPDLDLGPHLQSFKYFTSEMTPMDRGYAIDDFEFLRSTHNSFAREMDILQANMVLKGKHEKQVQQSKAEEKRKAQEAKKAAADTQAAEGGARRSGRKRKERVDADAEDVEDDDNEAGNHFIAYMPVGDNVWKMDGMDSYPQLVNRIGEGGNWLEVARQAIVERILEYPEGMMDFNLMSVVHDPYDAAKQALEQRQRDFEQATKQGSDLLGFRKDTPTGRAHETENATAMQLEKGDIPVVVNANHLQHSSPATRAADPAPNDTKDGRELSESPSGLESASEANDGMAVGIDANNNHSSNTDNKGLAAVMPDEEVLRLQEIVVVETEARKADDQSAMLRRLDYRPFLTEWVDALKEEDWFDTLLAVVKEK